jgi:hypothetical protein
MFIAEGGTEISLINRPAIVKIFILNCSGTTLPLSSKVKYVSF